MSNFRENNLDQTAERFKALSNPHRLQLFLKLAASCQPGQSCSDEAMTQCVGELSHNIGLAPSTISHHLKELHRSGLIHMRRNGKNVECWVNRETTEELALFFEQCKS
ncbi:ArsR/SmtB family transcription factor [Magnetococcus sp. PR-3]|uniref:ArsR/SmtB family transcription factor n=1 Tax=Magnetococcus sp. PR-3 TaxID=3120355 RepID=UPI002FCE0CEE